jgi:hypothetical protein
MRQWLLPAFVLFLGFPPSAAAQPFATATRIATSVGAQAPQPSPSRPALRRAVEAVAGYSGFIDESLVDHTIVGATFRYHIGRILSLGPEIVYMVGPGTDRDLFVTGNAVFDFLVPASGPRPGTVNPFVVVGAGFMVHRTRFADTGFSTTEGALTGGGGVRVWITDRVYALGQYRAGWEPHLRVDGGIGMAW